MSSTNKTTHYNLNQYVASDKPTYLVDYNADMSAIDSGIYAAKLEANTNTSTIGNLASLNTTAKTNLVGAINEIDGDIETLSGTVGQHTTDIATNTSAIGNLASLNTTAKKNLVSAVNEVNSDIKKFNLTKFKSYDVSSTIDVTNSNSNIHYNGTITIATNSDGSIFKLYGSITYDTSGSSSNQNGTLTLYNTGIVPSSAFSVFPAGFTFVNPANGQTPAVYGCSFDVQANGNIVISEAMSPNQDRIRQFYPSLYFAKNFGDVPDVPTL